MLPHYRFDTATALWRHEDGLPKPPASLADVDFTAGEVPPAKTQAIDRLPGYLAEAKQILEESSLTGGVAPALSDEAEALRWFPTPQEVGQ